MVRKTSSRRPDSSCTLDAWSLIVESKVNQEWHEFVLEPDDQWIGRVHGVVSSLERAWNNHELPPRLPEFPSKAPCSQCPFKADCEKIPVGGWMEDLIDTAAPAAINGVKIKIKKAT